MPEDFNDLYRLLPSVATAIKNHMMTGFPVRLDRPSHLALCVYDNNTFIAQHNRHTETDVRVGVTGEFTRLRNLVTAEVMARQAPHEESGQGRRGGGCGRGVAESSAQPSTSNCCRTATGCLRLRSDYLVNQRWMRLRKTDPWSPWFLQPSFS